MGCPGHNDHTHDIGDKGRTSKKEEQDKDNPYQDRVHIEIFGNTTADTVHHFVFSAFIQPFHFLPPIALFYP